VADYYARRAAGGAGFIITEGIFIPHPTAGYCSTIPTIGDQQAIAAWRKVVDAVHLQGAKIAAQLWHIGPQHLPGGEEGREKDQVSPSGLVSPGHPVGRTLSVTEIEELVGAYASAAANARDAGFDAIELHAGHGYLIDSFFWHGTNQRTDRYGGSLAGRTRFAAEIVRECRNRLGEALPIILRFSQWKNVDYDARLAETPVELEEFLAPLVDAGVDIFDCSTRRFWEPAFSGSDLGLAGWTRKISGKPVIVVGSVGLSTDLFASMGDEGATISANLGQLMEMYDRGDFDLVAVGRMLLAHHDWAERIAHGEQAQLRPFNKHMLETLT
jgi:2,4-dienoyl-CoA reductase-like NADH-dependent reductase (Old Yellow Enzyme family)